MGVATTMTAMEGFRSTSRRFRLSVIVCLVWCGVSNWWGNPAAAQMDFESAPIRYYELELDNPISRLQGKLKEGTVKLAYDPEHGYLPAMLEALDVPVSSQVLVFSKTSFQARLINRRHPRAVYFNDDVYIGWVQQGEVVEISVADPQQGAVFFALPQQSTERPAIVRDQGNCTVCHASTRTQGVPGHLIRSVYPDPSGQPNFGAGTFSIDQRSPFSQRWGGWYVSGTHGRQRHMGNVVVGDREHPEQMEVNRGANITDLSTLFDTDPYLSPHSDIVALLVLEHQVQMHNYITRANFETRAAIHHDEIMNRALERPADYRSESAQRRIAKAAEDLVDYMLFVDEMPLKDPVAGTSTFASDFAARGPADGQGRSLRQLDLSTRLMRYPCSYLIYSTAFDGLPNESRELVYRGLWEVLHGDNNDSKFSHLSASDRQAILEILRETKASLPEYWK